jgi:hypothetical protein
MIEKNGKSKRLAVFVFSLPITLNVADAPRPDDYGIVIAF